MAPFTVGLGLVVATSLGNVVMGIGLFCATTCVLIGVFPEDKVKIHFAVAAAFFIGMALLILLFTITIILQPMPQFPTWFIVTSIIALVVFASFIVDTAVLPKWELDRTNEPWAWEGGRPRFWLNPFLEWCAIFALLAWLFTLVILCFKGFPPIPAN
jgi:hypothetical protein